MSSAKDMMAGMTAVHFNTHLWFFLARCPSPLVIEAEAERSAEADIEAETVGQVEEARKWAILSNYKFI